MLGGITIYCIFFNYNSPPPRQFLCNKILLKKISISKGNAHKTNFWIDRAWAPGRICTPVTGCFQDKTIICNENNRLNCYLLLKYCWRDCTLLPPTRAKSLIKFNHKMQDFKRVLDLNCKQKEDRTTYFFNWLSYVKNLVLSNGSENVQNVIQWY